MNTMTLEQVRDWHRHQLNFLPESGVPTDLHQNAADAIDAHLAQTAKAVDVVVLRARMNGKAWQYYAPDYLSSEAISKLAGYGWEFERLTRAISGEKEGPVDGLSSETFGGWCNTLTHAYMYVTERSWGNAHYGIEAVLNDLREWQRKLTPPSTSPAPEKEVQS